MATRKFENIVVTTTGAYHMPARIRIDGIVRYNKGETPKVEDWHIEAVATSVLTEALRIHPAPFTESYPEVRYIIKKELEKLETCWLTFTDVYVHASPIITAKD